MNDLLCIFTLHPPPPETMLEMPIKITHHCYIKSPKQFVYWNKLKYINWKSSSLSYNFSWFELWCCDGNMMSKTHQTPLSKSTESSLLWVNHRWLWGGALNLATRSEWAPCEQFAWFSCVRVGFDSHLRLYVCSLHALTVFVWVWFPSLALCINFACYPCVCVGFIFIPGSVCAVCRLSLCLCGFDIHLWLCVWLFLCLCGFDSHPWLCLYSFLCWCWICILSLCLVGFLQVFWFSATV